MSEVLNRFMQYVQVDTQSDETSGTNPSTQKQFNLANILKNELISMGAKDVKLDDKCYVYATIPSNINHEVDTIGFIAHMDTSPDFSGANVKPRIIRNYDGKDIKLNDEVTMYVKEFTNMSKYIGKDLIVTDGNSLLGADDKAGIAAIMEAADILLHNNEIKHGTVKIAFTPDEEIGEGASNFDVKGFDAKFAYTVDGGEIAYIADETFNAASAEVTIHGLSVHPGTAKDKMINAINVGFEFHSLLPELARPEHTEDREGFYHLGKIDGDVSTCVMHYIIRNHDSNQLEVQKELLLNAAQYLNMKYDKDIVEAKIEDTYRNMHEEISKHPQIIKVAEEALKMMGIDPLQESVRGGTDGATLTYMGLPCPNIGTGGGNCHGKYEYCCIQELEQAVTLITNIATIVAKEGE